MTEDRMNTGEAEDSKTCGDASVDAGRDGVPGAYAFFARYVLMPWESCLDVGGGMGEGLSILRRRSRSARAIDQDARLAEFGVELGDVADEADRSYDWVVAVDVIEHVAEDRAFLECLWRVARKGIFLATPNLDHHPGRAWPYHVREYGADAFRALFLDACPGAALLQFGSGVYGGNMRMRHLSPDWEHQAVVAFKTRCALRACGLHVRERLLGFRKSKEETMPDNAS